MPEIAKNFAKLLQEANGRQIAVVGHMRPDGDCVSSQLAMAELLRNAGAKVVCLNQDTIPYLLKNFSSEKLLNIAEFDASGWDIVLVDCSSLERANVEFAKKYNKIFACIDHHASGKSQAEINVIDIQAGATAEIIALALAELDLNISEENATLLFAGIATDTRQFTTTSTRAESFIAANALMQRGARPNVVAQELYQRERFAKMQLLSVYLQSLQMYCDGKVCVGFIPLGTFEKTGSNKEDTDGLVDFARSIEGVEIAMTLEELSDGSVKGSLRGRNPDFKVNKIAENFGGGGHLAAAGFTAKNETFNSIIPKLIELCKKSIGK